MGYPNIPSGYPAYVPGISFCCEGRHSYNHIGFKNGYLLSKLTRYILIDPRFVFISFSMRFYRFFLNREGSE